MRCRWNVGNMSILFLGDRYKKGYARRKGYSKMEEDVVFLCCQGNDTVMVWMQILSVKAGKGREPRGSLSSYFSFLSKVTGKICSWE